MVVMHWNTPKKSLERFLGEDLPFLIKSHYNKTLEIVTELLQSSFNLSIDLLLTQEPAIIEDLNNQIYLYFLCQISKLSRLNNNNNFYDCYYSVSQTYQERVIYLIAEDWIESNGIRNLITN